VPYDVEDYIHRIGRTARAGDTGMAITFVAPEEQYRFEQIEEFLQKKIYRIPVPAEFGEVPEYNPSKNRRQRGAISSATRGRKSSKGGVSAKKQRFDNKGDNPKKKRIQKPHNNQVQKSNNLDNTNLDGDNIKQQ